MKYSKAEVHCKTHGLPALHFEDSQLTSFSGLVLIQALFSRLGLKERLRRCFGHSPSLRSLFLTPSTGVYGNDQSG